MVWGAIYPPPPPPPFTAHVVRNPFTAWGRPVSRAGFSLRLADHLLRLASRLAAAEPYSYGGGLLTRCAGGLPSRALASGVVVKIFPAHIFFHVQKSSMSKNPSSLPFVAVTNCFLQTKFSWLTKILSNSYLFWILTKSLLILNCYIIPLFLNLNGLWKSYGWRGLHFLRRRLKLPTAGYGLSTQRRLTAAAYRSTTSVGEPQRTIKSCDRPADRLPTERMTGIITRVFA